MPAPSSTTSATQQEELVELEESQNLDLPLDEVLKEFGLNPDDQDSDYESELEDF